MLKKSLLKSLATSCAAIFMLAAIPFTSQNVQAADALYWPVPGHTTLSQGFHDGNAIDISDGSIAGAKVVAAHAGTVTNVFKCGTKHCGSMGDCKGFGTGVVIKGTDGRFYQYAHMKSGSIPSNICCGAKVSAGQTVGAVGTTGNSSGNHLHFAIATGKYWNASGINPQKENYSAGQTVKVTYGALKASFIKTNNAKYYASISNPSGAKITKVGVQVWNKNGKMIKNYTETCNRTLKSFNQYIDLNKEAKLTLTKNSKYTIRFYAMTGTQTFYSQKVSFCTKAK